uniref:Uncharacterized protein n=1 Tax=Ursus americanus TaxID=9643 RepID=A0A452SA07_URSAM
MRVGINFFQTPVRVDILTSSQESQVLVFLPINYHPNCEAAVNSQTNLALYASYLYVHDDVALKRSARNSGTSSCWRGRRGRSPPSPGGWRTSTGPIACSIKTRGRGGCRRRESLKLSLPAFHMATW